MHIDFTPPTNGTYNNSGSSRRLANYLEHEDLERMEKGIYTEGFFNLTEDNIYKSKVIKDIDANIGQLLKTDAKFYAIHVSPSKKEIQAMGNTEQEQAEAMKRYIREVFIPEYAKNFNKELSATEIKFYGKIHFDRSRSNNELNIHCHLIVSRKDQVNKKKLSPLTNHKNTKNGIIKGGFEKEITKLWDDKSDEEKRELYLKILRFENNLEELSNSVAPLRLKTILKDKIELLAPSEWIVQKSSIIHELSNNAKILFLFDIEFKHAPLPDNRDGRDLAFELLQDSTVCKFLYCGIFSHLFSINDEYDKRCEYCKTHHLDKEKFYTISKKRFQNDSYLPGLAEGIRNTLLINEVEVLKKEAANILGNSFKNAINEIIQLAPESFNHIIQKSSRKEGVWEMDTLIRVSDIITSYNALSTLVSNARRTKINQCLKKIRQIESIKTGGETPFDKTQVLDLRHKELYIKDNIQNSLHYPLSNGDIFNIQGKEYILLVQPCNISLRKDGKRDRNYNIGLLVELETIEKETFQNYKKGQLATVEVIEDVTLPSNLLKVARFSTFQSVSLSPLDLTVFNKEGIAKINLSELDNTSSTIQESWKKRYKELHKIFSEFANGIKVFRKIRVANKDILKYSVFNGSVFTGYKINNEKSLSQRGKLLKFNITRVAHYKSPYSDDLLQKFMLYLSRNAFEHDFTKN